MNRSPHWVAYYTVVHAAWRISECHAIYPNNECWWRQTFYSRTSLDAWQIEGASSRSGQLAVVLLQESRKPVHDVQRQLAVINARHVHAELYRSIG